MAYPSFEQYNNAFSAHQKLLADPELQMGTVAKTALGTPLAISGGFALTYTIKTSQRKYAVRCFHRESKALERRYHAIAKRLKLLNSPYFLNFAFQPKGISINSQTYPIVKMAWAPGVTLGEYLEDNHCRKGALATLPASLLALSSFLEKERIAHGDMSTGNIMVSGPTNSIQLIDYDGMFVEEIRDLGNSELGNINFQHPERKAKNPFGPSMDRFSLIGLWLALKALNDDQALWSKTNSDMDAIVFRASDFIDPSSSLAFSELMRNPTIATHAQNFAAVCRASIEKTPSLVDFVAGKNIPVSTILITNKPREGRSKLGYLGIHDVLNANNYDVCLRRTGDKVEVVGCITEIKLNKASNGKPYIFINFGPWHGKIFKISIWSEGLASISKKPDASWIGKWISVVGLMEPPYTSKQFKYTHLSINVTANGQMTIISEAEAKFRLTPPSTQSYQAPTSNREALEKIKGRPTLAPTTPAPLAPKSSNKAILDNIKRAQGGGQRISRQAQTHPSQIHPRPTQIHPHQAQTTITPRRQQPTLPSCQLPNRPKAPKQNLLAKFFSWLFK